MPRVAEQISCENPKVSVHMITYNHEKFIAQAIESVLMQETDFPVELIIGEDCSTDNTRQIVKNYAEKYPNVIRALLPKRNLGMQRNSIAVFAACRGQYIACLEGDDFWTDKLKLKIQVSKFLEDAGLAVCFHNAMLKNTRNGADSECVFHAKLDREIFYTKDLLCQWFIPTASIMFKNYADFKFPAWFYDCQSGDIPLLLLLSLHGHVKYVDRVMSTYRLHDQGISLTHVGYDKVIGMIHMYQCFNIYTHRKFSKEIKEAIIGEIRSHLPDLQRNPAKSRNLIRRILSRLKREWDKL
jgi:glycosyltransferase involved in cell wall biosynthesis